MSKKTKTLSYIVTFKLDINDRDTGILNKRFEIARKLYNSILGEGLKRYKILKERKLYRKIKKEISSLNKQLYNCKDENRQKIIDKERKVKYKELKDVCNDVGFNEYSLINAMTPMYKPFKKNIDNKTAQALASRTFKALDKLEKGEARKVFFKRYDELYSIEGKWNRSGITYRNGSIRWNKLEMPIIIKNNDLYAQKAIQGRVKYCRLKREYVKGKAKYYVQLVIEGIPPTKFNKKTGEVKNKIDTGDVGIDIGTQTIAYSSKKGVGLLELAPEINNIDREVKLMQRKMDRSKRATNCNKYNEDGTIKWINRDKLVYSNRYNKVKLKRKELYRKQKELRKQSHEILANKILSLGNTIYVEDMNYKGLQKRSKKTTKNKDGRYNSKNRFGKSLANKAPSMFLRILDNKLKWQGKQLIKINTKKVKASQYNHINDEYNKKDLKERWNDFGEYKIQRDLYSAFLIMNVNDTLDEVNREKCINRFEVFKKMHYEEIERIRRCEDKKIASMGL